MMEGVVYKRCMKCCRACPVLLWLLVMQPLTDAQAMRIAVNQAGYAADVSKYALVLDAGRDERAYEVVDRRNGRVVLTVQAGAPEEDHLTRLPVQRLDLSRLHQPGQYYLRRGTVKSASFSVAEDPYRPALRLLLRTYYLQRCGHALADEETGLGHAACHEQDGLLAHKDRWHRQGEHLSVTGGWHDAGDYGKYLASATITAARLLTAYEQHEALGADGWLSIPESGNGVPDILDEAKVGLDWMLSMQREDGAVYRKLSGRQWPPHGSPANDRQARLIYGPASSDTAKFAAVMALAARVIEPWYAADARRYRQAALAAWHSLADIRQQQVDWHEGDDSGSGKYLYSAIDNEDSLLTDVDDRFWAAVELYHLTGDRVYHDYVRRHMQQVRYTLFGWKNPAALGVVHYLQGAKQDPRVRAVLHKMLMARADHLLATTGTNVYRLAETRFIWGSNKRCAEHGITLMQAYRLSGKPAYLLAARAQADYLLGINPFAQSFVSGLGSHAVQHVHHSWREDIPGLLVGGPNAGAQDGIAPKDKGILSYVDDARSYATNEYAIDYNAALIGLLAELQYAQRH